MGAYGFILFLAAMFLSIIIAPFVLYWVTKRFNFTNNYKKKHAIFWFALIMVGSTIEWILLSALSTEISVSISEVAFYVVFMAVFVWMLQLVFDQGLGKAIGSAFVFMLIMLLSTTVFIFLLIIVSEMM